MRTLRSEWVALTTTRALAGHLGAATLLGLLPLLILPLVGDAGAGAGVPDLASAEGQRSLLSGTQTAYLLAAILGAVVATRRHRHRTIVGQLLATPDRRRAALAQGAVLVLAGILLGLVTAVVTLGATTAGLAIIGESLAVSGATLARIALAAAFAGAVGGALGTGCGALIRNAGAAITVVVLLVFVVDGLVGALLPEVGQWLPGQLLARVEQGADAAFVAGDVDPPLALVVVALQGLAVLVAGVVATVRRDVV